MSEWKTFDTSILDRWADGIIIVDDGRIVYANGAFMDMTGFEAEELTSKRLSPFIADPDHGPGSFLPGNGGEGASLTVHLRRRDGSTFMVRAAVSPTRDGGGRSICVFTPLPAGKSIEEEYRHLVENASDIIYRNDSGGRFTYINPVGIEKLGYGRENILGKNYLSIVSPDQRSEVLEFYRGLSLREPGETVYHELKIIRGDGTEMWIGQNAKLVRDDDGSIGFYAVARDISELKKVQEALKESERKYRELVEQKTRDIIFTADGAGLFLTANSNLQAKLGYAERDVRGKRLSTILYDDPQDPDGINRESFRENIAAVLEQGRSDVRFRASCVHRYLGEPVILQFKLDPVVESGRVTGLVGFASSPSDDPLREFLVDLASTYEIDNRLTTAEELSHRLTRDIQKFCDIDEAMQIRMGIREMIVNAIEHGNLGITFDEKTEAQGGNSYIDLLYRRQADPSTREKKVRVTCELNRSAVRYTVTDQGNGFNFREILDTAPENMNDRFLLHGRGIFMARGIFDEIEYRDEGRTVTLLKHLAKSDNGGSSS